MPITNTVLVGTATTAAQFQSMIDSAGAGTQFRLAEGIFAFDRTIRVSRDDISITGAGSDRTVIKVPSGLGAEAFKLGNGAMTGDFKITANIAEGGKTVTLSGSHSFAVGDYMYLDRESTSAFYDEIGDATWRNTDVPLRTSIVKVAAVNGSTITLESGVHFDFVPSETTVKEINLSENLSIGGFTVDYGLGKANPSDFANRLAAYDRNAVIEVNGTSALRLFDITSRDVPSIGANFALSRDVHADRLTFSGAHNKGDGGNGYAFQLRDTYDGIFTNLADADMRHSVLFASWRSAVGNDVHVLRTDRDINYHGGRHHANTVTVEQSLRDANSDIISPTLFNNSNGTHYGTVTDPDANKTFFLKVMGSRLADNVTGVGTGAWLDGAGGNDTLRGGGGRDVLIGGVGTDSLIGGAGEDVAVYLGNRSGYRTASNSVEHIAGTYGKDALSGVEWVKFDDAAIRLSDMTIHAAIAVDAILQAAGKTSSTSASAGSGAPADTGAVSASVLLGTAANDSFSVSKSGVTVKGLGGTDTVSSSVSFALGSDTERLVLSGTAAIDGTGNEVTNRIQGNGAANRISGLGGDDSLRGGAGNDHVDGGAGNDAIGGDAGNDRLVGGDGDDRLTGGSGADVLVGGTGDDVFVFTSIYHSRAANADTIADFQPGLDHIDLRGMDANTAVSGDQAFRWVSNPTGSAGEVWVKSAFLMGDVNGDGVADFQIGIGAATLTAGDFLF